MAHYKANSTNSTDFNLTLNDVKIGELQYSEWYSFKAKILLADNSDYQLEPKGFWDSKIELKKEEKTLLTFRMGWKGIIIKTNFQDQEITYLLKLKGLLSSKFVLVDTDEKELLAVSTDFKWKKLNFDYTIETSNEFDHFKNRELFLLTILHCINYYITVTAAVA